MDTFDFIVVGAGSAGCCVAARLGEIADAKVLVLEAGPAEPPADLAPNVSTPYLWYTLLYSKLDWNYDSTPQTSLGGRAIHEPRGKLAGGSSNLYIMMHIRGDVSDYDNWAYNGCPGWSYQECLPYFQKMEDQEDNTSPWAGHGGPLHVANAGLHNPNPTSRVFLEACKELGYPHTDDFNGPNMIGAGWHHINVKDGKRHSMAVAYLYPAVARGNVTLEGAAQATRLLFEGTRCVGVEYSQNGQLKTARATKEVVVAGGAIESPHLLQLSGIGKADDLKAFGIPVVADLPGVGENFHNHVLSGVINEMSQPVPAPHQNLSEAALFCKSDPGWVGPDLQFSFVHVPFNIIIGQGHPNSVSILPGVVRPMSKGWVRLASADPLAKPLVNANYLSAQSDVDRMAQAVDICRDIFATSAFKPWTKGELMPGPDVKKADLKTWVKQNCDSYHHQAGSCKMGSDALAVVDPQLRVYGIEGLRVADASVMPMVPSGNCHAGIVMIGERCADFIKQAHNL